MTSILLERPVTQAWVHTLPLMQQTVLLTAIRGPDGMPKYGPVKMLLRWYRRCFLLSAMDGGALTNPYDSNGGSFTGPSLVEPDPDCDYPKWEGPMDLLVGQYLRTLDAIPHHFHMHFVHAAEILGYKHSDDRIRSWWHKTYVRFVNDMHLIPEPEADMDKRLGDNRGDWLSSNDPATVD